MKIIEKKSVVPIDSITGSIVDTRNVDNLETNALSIAQMNRENTYSTEETFTGKYWIDEKPIYRKVIQGTIPNEGTFLPINLNYDTLVFERLSLVSTSGYIVTNGTFDTECILSYMIGVNTVYFSTVGSGFVGNEFTLIAEYTKTTD